VERTKDQEGPLQFKRKRAKDQVELLQFKRKRAKDLEGPLQFKMGRAKDQERECVQVSLAQSQLLAVHFLVIS